MFDKSEKYQNIPPPANTQPDVSGDKTTSCGGCRTKMANATFDMTAGFNQSDLITKTLSTRDRIELDRRAKRSGSPDNHFNTPNNPADLQRSTIEELCYGGNCDTVTLGYKPVDAIGELYGISPPPSGDPFDPTNPVVGDADPFTGSDPGVRIDKKQPFLKAHPCLDTDFKYLFNRFKNDFKLDNEGNITFNFSNISITLNIKDLIFNTLKKVYCWEEKGPLDAIYYSGIATPIWNRLRKYCEDNKLETGFYEFNYGLEGEVALSNLLIFDLVSDGYELYYDKLIPIRFFNKDGSHDNSCLCGGQAPTYCCDPDKFPGKCLCNGKPQNLCELCNVEITIPLPLKLNIFDERNDLSCWAKLGEHKTDHHKIEVRLLDPNGGILWNGNEKNIDELPFYNVDPSRRVYHITIPDRQEVNLVLIFNFGCGWCCSVKKVDQNDNIIIENTNRRRKFVLEFPNFSFLYWQSLTVFERDSFIENKFNEVAKMKGVYGSEEFNKNCVEC